MTGLTRSHSGAKIPPRRKLAGGIVILVLNARVAAVVTVIAIGLSLAQRAWAAGGAYVVDDAEVGDAGECKVDTWAAISEDDDRAFVAAPGCVFAGLPMVEWELQIQHNRESGEHSNDLGGQAKIALIPVDRFGVGVALTAGVGYGLREDRISGNFVNVPVTIDPTERLRINVNVGWDHDDIARQDFLTWGAGAEWEIAPDITIIGEMFGANEGRPGWQAGPRLTVLDGAIDLDLIAGQNITDVHALWLTIGVTARF